MEFTVSYGLEASEEHKTIKFQINNAELLDFIKSSENPVNQCKSIIHNGYLMNKCMTPTTVTCGCCGKLDNLAECLLPMTEQFSSGNSSKSGKLCEVIMGNIFKKTFPGIEYEDTAGIDRNGDAIITLDGHKIMIDYKNYTQVIPTSEVDKLVRDLKFRDIPMGIIYSTNTRVSKKDVIDYDIIEGKLVVYMTGEGMSSNALIIAVKFIVHLYKSNVVSISDRVCELVNKSTGSKLQSIYKRMLTMKDSMVRHCERITEVNEKNNKGMNTLKEEMIHMISSMTEVLGEAEEIVEETHSEFTVIHTPRTELVDRIHRMTDKKKDRTLCLRFLNLADELNIICGISDKFIVLFKDGVDIGKLKITKSNVTLIVRKKDKGRIMIDCDNEELKPTGFHLTLIESEERWNSIKYRLNN